MSKRGNGEGTIYYSENLKRWIGQFTAGYQHNGKINRKTVYGKTRKEVADKIILKQNEVNTNIFVNKSEILFIDLASLIIKEQYESNLLNDNSFNRKIQTLKILQKTNLSNMKIQKIQIQDINFALSNLKNYSNSSISKIKILINSVFDKAVLLNIININPFSIKGAIIIPKSTKQNKKIEALTIEEQKSFLNELSTQDNIYKDILLIALYTGMRIGEILALQKADIDLKNNVIHISKTLTKNKLDKPVLGVSTKTYSGVRDIPILPQIKDIFYKYNDELIFTYNNKLINNSTINSHFKRICKNANIRVSIIKKKKNKNGIISFINLKTSIVNTHMLRHTFATRCIEAGMQAVVLQKILGHKDITITLNTYTSVFNNFKNNEIDKITNYFNKI